MIFMTCCPGILSKRFAHFWYSKLTLTQHKVNSATGISDTPAPFPALGLFWDGSSVVRSSRDTSALLSPVLQDWPDEPLRLALAVKLLLLFINETSCCRCRYKFIRGTQLYSRPYALVTVYKNKLGHCNLKGSERCMQYRLLRILLTVWRKQE